MQAPKQDFSQTMSRIDDDEKVLAIIKRHIFGIVKIYIQVAVGLVAAGGLVLFLLPELITREDYPDLYNLLALAALGVIGFMVFLLFVATYLYRMSQIVVTDKTITQTIQEGLFSRKVSQLAVSNIEDVTADKHGFFPSIFDYGGLVVETAGEQKNFNFAYCPSPDHYAKLILEARQEYLEARREEASVNQGIPAFGINPGVPQGYAQYQYQQPPQGYYPQQPAGQPQMQNPVQNPQAPAQPVQQASYSSVPLPPVPQDQQLPVGPDNSGQSLPPTV